jgi:hypothetical protein
MKKLVVVAVLLVAALAAAPADARVCLDCIQEGGGEFCIGTSYYGWCECQSFYVFSDTFCVARGGFCVLGAFCGDEGPPTYGPALPRMTNDAAAALHLCGMEEQLVAELQRRLTSDKDGVPIRGALGIAEFRKPGATLKLKGRGWTVKNDGGRLLCTQKGSSSLLILPHPASPTASGAWLSLDAASPASIELLK